MDELMIKLDLERMKYSFMSYVSNYNKEIEKKIETQLTELIENFDYESFVIKSLDECLRSTIRERIWAYLRNGEGSGIVDAKIEEVLLKSNLPGRE